MAVRVCWDCGVRTHMTPYGSAFAVPVNAEVQLVSGVFRCDNCDALSIGRTKRLLSLSRADPTQWVDRQDELAWIPLTAIGKDFPDVPVHVAEAATEAYMCASVGACRAASLLARSVIEATAKDKGITKGNLVDKIDEMFSGGLIREYVRDGAHEVRHFGNDMAHGDFIDPVTSDDAELALTLMSEVLQEVYQAPARVEKARAARAANKKA